MAGGADYRSVGRLDAVFEAQEEFAFALAQEVRAEKPRVGPEGPELAAEGELEPGSGWDEVSVLLGNLGGEKVLRRSLTAGGPFGEAAHGVFVYALDAEFDGGAHADHHQHQVVAAVEGIVFLRDPVSLDVTVPKLADGAEVGEAAGPVGREVLGVFLGIEDQVPLGERQVGGILVALVFRRRGDARGDLRCNGIGYRPEILLRETGGEQEGGNSDDGQQQQAARDNFDQPPHELAGQQDALHGWAGFASRAASQNPMIIMVAGINTCGRLTSTVRRLGSKPRGPTVQMSPFRNSTPRKIPVSASMPYGMPAYLK